MLSKGLGTITISLTSYFSRSLSEFRKTELAASCFGLAGPGQVPQVIFQRGSNLVFPFTSICNWVEYHDLVYKVPSKRRIGECFRMYLEKLFSFVLIYCRICKDITSYSSHSHDPGTKHLNSSDVGTAQGKDWVILALSSFQLVKAMGTSSSWF